MALVIYTKPGCPYCQQARDYYNSKGITFIDHDAQTNRELRAEMLKFSGGDSDNASTAVHSASRKCGANIVAPAFAGILYPGDEKCLKSSTPTSRR